MDKRNYYRILGIREGATSKEIKAAYEARIQKLNSPDYADDPEYTQRKISETKYAYSVVMGSAAPATKEQKEMRYEEYKDAIEKGDEPKDFAEKSKRRIKTLNASVATANAKKKLNDTIGGAYVNGKPAKYSKPFAAITLVVILSIISSIISACEDISYSEEVGTNVNYIETNNLAVQRVLERYEEYDFDDALKDGAGAGVSQDKIEWDISDEVYEDLWNLTNDLAYAMGIYSVPDAVEYITGDEDFYWDNDDLTISEVIASIMDAPQFEEVAGEVNAYNDEAILDYGSYMRFLICVAEEQTDLICDESIEY